ncbi:DUF1566 domain-containing protein [Psychrobium sp. nBUS_13]|uniref:Lcl C-terminal domain-containing protein n=1 Tax=Psychrobium sp. nBUS_13 TaxID=3395319 RepID=UPI003EBC1DD7
MKKLLLALTVAASFTAVADQTCVPNAAQSTPTANFIANDNGTVTDRATNLMWMRCTIGQTFNAETKNCDGQPQTFFWQDALQAAESVRTNKQHAYYQFAGVTNWRVPNIKELTSIRETACYNPALNETIFPNSFVLADGGYAYLWSATHLAADSDVSGDGDNVGIMIMDLNFGGTSVTISPTDYRRQILLVADPKAQ